MIIILLAAILGGAVVMDVLSYRIKNSYLIPAFVLAIFYTIWTRGTLGVMETILSLVAVLVCSVPVFAVKGIGAADVKLFCIIACFYLPQTILLCMLLSLVLGGIVGIGILLYKVLTTHQISKSNLTHIHFSIPIAMSVLLQIGGIY